jgi:hypothetical protein
LDGAGIYSSQGSDNGKLIFRFVALIYEALTGREPVELELVSDLTG